MHDVYMIKVISCSRENKRIHSDNQEFLHFEAMAYDFGVMVGLYKCTT